MSKRTIFHLTDEEAKVIREIRAITHRRAQDAKYYGRPNCECPCGCSGKVSPNAALSLGGTRCGSCNHHHADLIDEEC